ncbi:hypothetical protein D3C72_2145390 [compost metagenome]
MSAENPQDWIELPMRPVMGVVVSLAAGAIVLFDYTKFLALKSDGSRWSSPDMSSDGLFKIREFCGRIYGEGWSAPEAKNIEFEIDIATGESVGGANPPGN